MAKYIGKQFLISNNQAIVSLNCQTSFSDLTEQQKTYAHYLCQAAWAGYPIILAQSSPESPLIFSMLHRIFLSEPIEKLKAKTIAACCSEQDFQAFLMYACAIFYYGGNYNGFTNTKILPNLELHIFETIVCLSIAYEKYKEIPVLLDQVCGLIYALSNRESLGINPKGITSFWSENCTQEDMQIVDQYLLYKNIEPWLTRVFKLVENDEIIYNIQIASVLKHQTDLVTSSLEMYFGHKFTVTRGDFAKILRTVNDNLIRAKPYALSRAEGEMLLHYRRAFHEGLVNEHKKASECWMKDQQPVVEAYIGFVETCRDPAHERGVFEGLVAIVNKEITELLTNLTARAQEFLQYLPWTKDYEESVYKKPDLIVLDVLNYASFMLPFRLSLPNYQDIRKIVGFKTFAFSNIFPLDFPNGCIPFLEEPDQILLKQCNQTCYIIQYALRELVGRSSGKLFRVNAKKKYNFNIKIMRNLIDGDEIKSCYKPCETFESKFGKMAAVYEECRIEAVALYLQLFPDVLDVFNIFVDEERQNVVYGNWLYTIWLGFGVALASYDTKSKNWCQADMCARFVIARVLLEAEQFFVNLEMLNHNTDMCITIDANKIETVGKNALGNFLLKLQVYKSTADIKSAQNLIAKYATISNCDVIPWLKWREIVLAKQIPRAFCVQPNTYLEKGIVQLKTYDANVEGFIQSYLDRFPTTQVDEYLEEIFEYQKQYFPSINKVW